jgi:hypothetical protein
MANKFRVQKKVIIVAVVILFMLLAILILRVLFPGFFVSEVTFRDFIHGVSPLEVTISMCKTSCSSYCLENRVVENVNWSTFNVTFDGKNTNCGDVLEGSCSC